MEDSFWNFGTLTSIGFIYIYIHTMEVNGAKKRLVPIGNRSSKYLPLSSAEERNLYRFATT